MVDDPLTAVLRDGARRLLAQVLISADTGPRGNVNIQCTAALINVETHR